MIRVPAGTQIWVACGATDMRKGFDGLGFGLVASEQCRNHAHIPARRAWETRLARRRRSTVTSSFLQGGEGSGAVIAISLCPSSRPLRLESREPLSHTKCSNGILQSPHGGEPQGCSCCIEVTKLYRQSRDARAVTVV
jgi:hypothetical protein